MFKWSILLFLPFLLWAEEKETLILIKAPKEANSHTPFYILIKPASFTQFLHDDYYKIVDEKLKNQTPFLHVSCIVPGETKLISFKTKEKEAVALYCLFTKPGEEWKYFIDGEGPRKIKMLIKENEIGFVSRFN